ncbi:MAG: hypothetical protein HYW00_02215, partial [Candidatus Colwellbacteria bacterium]|nr:hypothetical protein [Candidatus Colwellbacteria bacterium]
MAYPSREEIFFAETEEELLGGLELGEYDIEEWELEERSEDTGVRAESGLDLIIERLGGTPEDWQYENFSGPETYFRNNEIIYADNRSLTKEIFGGDDPIAIAKHEEMLEALRSNNPFVFDGTLESVHYGTIVRLAEEGQLQYENFSHRIEKEEIEEDWPESEEVDIETNEAFSVSEESIVSTPREAEDQADSESDSALEIGGELGVAAKEVNAESYRETEGLPEEPQIETPVETPVETPKRELVIGSGKVEIVQPIEGVARPVSVGETKNTLETLEMREMGLKPPLVAPIPRE